MKLTNKSGLPEVLARAVYNDSYDPGDSDVTVTGLIAPPRQTILRWRHDHEITEDVADRLWALFGQVVHGILERAGENLNVLTEDRLYKDVEYAPGQSYKVGGQVDSMTITQGREDAQWTIRDYKFVTVYRFLDGSVPQEYEEQLNAYAAIFRANGFAIDRLELLAVYRDWSVGKSNAGGGYPPKGAGVWPVKVWPAKTAEEWLIHKVISLANASQMKSDELPECTPEERWAKADRWAVMKKGRKSAVRVLYSKVEAQSLLHEKDGNHYIEHRPGESVRCESYCNVSQFCNQWKAIQHEKVQ